MTSKNDMVTLSALEPEDLELLYTIENDAALWQVGTTNVPYSRYALRDYIANQQNDIYADRQVRFVIRLKPDGEAIGLIDLFNFSPEHSRAEVGIAILRRHQDKGYGAEALRMLLQYARETLHLHQVVCVVPAGNLPSLAIMRRCGFCHEAVLHDWLQTAEGWQDAVSMQYIF